MEFVEALVKHSSRRFIVFTTLIGVLTLTSALLLALSPAPLAPDVAGSLFAIDSPDTMDAVFKTTVPCQRARWNYIYIRHSQTAGGNAMTVAQSRNGVLADHFVIGNGDGAVDGEVQVGQRWDSQDPALPPPGAAGIDPKCISICLIGDFDRTRPTPTQLRRLVQLTNALQARFHIRAEAVTFVDQPGSAAGVGRFFPTAALREQLLP